MSDRSKIIGYLHTVDDRPGYFDGEQIVFAEKRNHWQDDYNLCVLATTEAQIREEQAASAAFRKRCRFGDAEEMRYGFVVVSLKHGVLPPPGKRTLNYSHR